MGVAFGQID